MVTLARQTTGTVFDFAAGSASRLCHIIGPLGHMGENLLGCVSNPRLELDNGGSKSMLVPSVQPTVQNESHQRLLGPVQDLPQRKGFLRCLGQEAEHHGDGVL